MCCRQRVPRHLYYLQLRRDVLEERCHVNEDQALDLAGVALQAEYGDYSETEHQSAYFQPDHYYSQRNLRRLGTGYVRDNTPGSHLKYAGLDQEEAEWRFMKLLQQAPEYGVHFYKVYRVSHLYKH